MAAKHPRWKVRKSDKFARSNRGRVRTAAVNGDQKHKNLSQRLSKANRNILLRDAKRSERNTWRNELAEQLFDLELAKFDPDVWLYKTNLTTYQDQLPKGGWFKYQKVDTDPRVVAHYMWDDDFPDDGWGDWDGEAEYEKFSNDSDDIFDETDYSDPEPTSELWRDMWVAGRVNDEDGRDYTPSYDYWDYDDDYDYDYDPLKIYEEYLSEHRDSKSLPYHVYPDFHRDMERHKAGERYFRTTKRTVVKPLVGASYIKKVA